MDTLKKCSDFFKKWSCVFFIVIIVILILLIWFVYKNHDCLKNKVGMCDWSSEGMTSPYPVGTGLIHRGTGLQNIILGERGDDSKYQIAPVNTETWVGGRWLPQYQGQTASAAKGQSAWAAANTPMELLPPEAKNDTTATTPEGYQGYGGPGHYEGQQKYHPKNESSLFQQLHGMS